MSEEIWMSLEVTVSEHDGVFVCSLNGELDMASEPDLDARLLGLEAQGPDVLVLDLEGLAFMDSSGLRALLRARERAKREGHRLVLARPADHVARVLELTGALPWFEVVVDPTSVQRVEGDVAGKGRN